MSGLGAELRQALRRLARRPAISFLAVALLGVGIGGDLALLGVVDAMLFRQPPVEAPDRLVRIVKTDEKRQYFDNWSFPNIDDLRRGTRSLTGVAIFADWRNVHLAVGAGESVRLKASLATANYFEVLGSKPALGRLLVPADDAVASGPPAVVLGYDLWRTRFAADAAVVGREVRLNGHPFTVVGVAPRGFASLDPTMAPQLWLPISAWRAALNPQDGFDRVEDRGSSWLDAIGRLAPGATLAAAQAELDGAVRQLAKVHPEEMSDTSAWLMSLSDAAAGGPAERGRAERQAMLVAAVGLLVLLAVAANLAALLAARAAQSRHESAVRAALGADRARLRAPLMAEGALLTAAGAALGLLLVGILQAFAVRSLAFILPLADGGSLDLLGSPRMLGWGAAVIGLTLAVVTLLPGRAAARMDIVRALRREEARPLRGPLAAADALVVAQVALSVLLLAAATLLVARFRELSATAPGFQARGVVQASFDLGLQGYDQPRAAAFERTLVDRLRGRFGAGNVALTDWSPLVGGWSRTSVAARDARPGADGRAPNADVAAVSPEIFQTLGLHLLRGRLFATTDTPQSPRVAVINETMARRYFAGRDAVGEIFHRGDASGPAIEVVGVVADARFRDLASPVPPMFFESLGQFDHTETQLTLLVRSDTGDAASVAAVRAAAAELDPELPLYRSGPLAEQVSGSIRAQRTSAQLFGAFAALVLALAAAGLAALMLSAVARRRREIGIRLALGAARRSIVALLLARSAALVGGGALAGLAVAALALPWLGEAAGGDAGLHPGVAAGALALLAMAALAATLLPARRALGIDPAETLRSE